MPLHVERRERVAVLTLDEPERRNALTADLVQEIVTTVDRLEDDEEIGALVVTGAAGVLLGAPTSAPSVR